MRLLKQLSFIYRLVRPNFLTLILIGTYLYALYPNISVENVKFICLAAFFFGPVMYSGLHMLNDYADFEKDKFHPVKNRYRPLAKGEISKNKVLAIASGLIIVGMIGGFFVSQTLFKFQIVFIAINCLYTFILKKLAYLDLIMDASTKVLRGITGIVLAIGTFSPFKTLVITHILSALITATGRRLKGMESKTACNNYNGSILYYSQYVYFIIGTIHLLATLQEKGLIIRLIILYGSFLTNIFWYKTAFPRRSRE